MEGYSTWNQTGMLLKKADDVSEAVILRLCKALFEQFHCLLHRHPLCHAVSIGSLICR